MRSSLLEVIERNSLIFGREAVNVDVVGIDGASPGDIFLGSWGRVLAPSPWDFLDICIFGDSSSLDASIIINN